MGTDPSSLQPGSFDADFKAASEVKMSEGGGMLGKLRAASENAMAMMKNGTAERHYIAGNKERTDQIAAQTATILDCAARTLTTLDLKNKTYKVESLDHPAGPGGPPTTGSSRPAPTATDDGSKVAIALTTKSLGPKQLSGENANGYSSDMKTTLTKANGESNTNDMLVTAYYSGTSQPRVACPGSAYATTSAAVHAPGPQAAPMMTSYAVAMRALRTPSGDPRFTVTSSGPALPVDKLPLWELVTFQKGQNFGILSERGNLHSVSDSDPVFSVPSDFTKQS
jgi:hypothetical protein